jgi:hypothetical protein
MNTTRRPIGFASLQISARKGLLAMETRPNAMIVMILPNGLSTIIGNLVVQMLNVRPIAMLSARALLVFVSKFQILLPKQRASLRRKRGWKRVI